MRVWKNTKKIFIHGAMRVLCVCFLVEGGKKNELINFFFSFSLENPCLHQKFIIEVYIWIHVCT